MKIRDVIDALHKEQEKSEKAKEAQRIIDLENNKILENKAKTTKLVKQLEKRGYNVDSLKSIEELVRIAKNDRDNGTNDLNTVKKVF